MKTSRFAAAGIALALALAAVLGTVLDGRSPAAQVVEGPATVIDERTLRVGGAEGSEIVRLWGLEPLADPQPARDTLAHLVEGRTVWCAPVGGGDHPPARCFVANENIATLLLARGEARTSGSLRGGEKDWVRGYKVAEAQAQHAHLGVWHE